jgi:hypothetical protein
VAIAFLSDDSVKISFSGWEKLFGLVHDAQLPLAAISDVSVAPDGYSAPSGLRAPGLAVPGRVKVGTWRGRGRRQLISVRRGQPAIHLRLSDVRVTDVIIGMEGAESLAAALRSSLKPSAQPLGSSDS